MKLASILLAATSAGFLASALLSAHTMQSKPKESVGTTLNASTAKVFQYCNIVLPKMQDSSFAQALNPWSPLWLRVQQNEASAQDTMCAQLLSTSLQGPTPTAAEDASFLPSLADSVQEMQKQIAARIEEDATLATELAPLMGMSPQETQLYFQPKATISGPPEQRRTPTDSGFMV